MKNLKIKVTLVSLLLLFVLKLSAQETVTIPLTNPDKEGFLKMGIINGSITIKGSNTKEVIVKGTKVEKARSYYSGRKTSKNDVRPR